METEYTDVSVKTDMMSFILVVVEDDNLYSARLLHPITDNDVFAFSVDAIINNKHEVDQQLIFSNDSRDFTFQFKKLSNHSASTPNGRVGIIRSEDHNVQSKNN